MERSESIKFQSFVCDNNDNMMEVVGKRKVLERQGWQNSSKISGVNLSGE